MSADAKRVLIVDDEPAARAQLRHVIETMPQLELIKELESGQSAISAITEFAPDIVFLDIDMPEVDGFAVARATEHIPYQLVFVTAHHKYALEAFNTHAIDYLLKPARPTLIEKCLNKILRQEILTLDTQPAASTHSSIVLSDSNTDRVIPIDHVLYIEGLGRYRRIHLSKDGANIQKTETLLSDTTLEEFTTKLDDESFARVHRGYLVNLGMVTALKTMGRQHIIMLKSTTKTIPVARSRYKEVKKILRNRHEHSDAIKSE